MRFTPIPAEAVPQLVHPPYRSTVARGPRCAPVPLVMPAAVTPWAFRGDRVCVAADADLTARGHAAPIGEPILITGRVTDEDDRPVPESLIEVWQCNAAGRYWHRNDQHAAPLDPNFFGFGKFMTDRSGRYRFVTIKPGPYPWGNHHKAWRPAHIHFSLFGNVPAQRLVTQMYFPGDPLFAFDPIFGSIPDPAARERLVATFSMDDSIHDERLAYVFDIVLRGRDATPFGL